MFCCKEEDKDEYFGICTKPVLQNDLYLTKMLKCKDVKQKFICFFIFTKPDEFNSKLLIFKLIFDDKNTIPLLSPSLERKLFNTPRKTERVSFLYTVYKFCFSKFKFNQFIQTYTLENIYIYFFFNNKLVTSSTYFLFLRISRQVCEDRGCNPWIHLAFLVFTDGFQTAYTFQEYCENFLSNFSNLNF